MSSDNGIYVAKFPPKFEGDLAVYKVSETSAIDNCDDNDRSYPTTLTDSYRVLTFSGPWLTENEAQKLAFKMGKEIYTEYGIVQISYDRELPPWSQGKAKVIQQEFWNSRSNR